MGTISIIVIALTAVALVFGTLYGLKRGRNRSILRLILILGCVAGAIFLREPVIEFLMELDVVQELLQSLAGELPEAFQLYMLVLIGIVLNLLVYFILFFILRIVSWLILFPILKIFVKTEVDKRKGAGALIGLIQGIVIAFAVLVPLNGLAVQLDRISQVKMEMPAEGEGSGGEQAGAEQGNSEGFSLEIPEELGLSEYAESGLSNIFGTIGDWYFDMITTVKISEEANINFEGVCDVTISMAGIMSSMTEINDGIEMMKDNGTATDVEKAQKLSEVGSSLSQTGKTIDQMGKGSKLLLNYVIDSFGQQGEGGEEGEGEGNSISLEELDLSLLGKAFTSLGNYYENGEVTLNEAQNIVNGLVDNWSIIESMLGSETLIDMQEESEEFFITALAQVEQSQKTKIMQIFGIKA